MNTWQIIGAMFACFMLGWQLGRRWAYHCAKKWLDEELARVRSDVDELQAGYKALGL